MNCQYKNSKYLDFILNLFAFWCTIVNERRIAE
nr:MAG TPA: hypothetical protein [Caudoviricetes sp.]